MGPGTPKAAKDEDGKINDNDGMRTYKIQSDGTMDWYAYPGSAVIIRTVMFATDLMAEGSTDAPGSKASTEEIRGTLIAWPRRWQAAEDVNTRVRQ